VYKNKDETREQTAHDNFFDVNNKPIALEVLMMSSHP
jgi:hypothetical protein